jgi:hypothetical protein
VPLDCIGGFVFTVLYGLSRPTADVDVLEIAPGCAADAFPQVAMLGGPLFTPKTAQSVIIMLRSFIYGDECVGFAVDAMSSGRNAT